MDFDVAIVGAGPAGCIAARDIARSGLKVALFDVRSRDRIGKTVVVEVERAMFPGVHVAPPVKDEIPYHPRCVRLFSPWGREAFVLEGELPSVAVYLDKLIKRLFSQAEDAGARFFGGHRAVEPTIKDGRVCGVSFQVNGGTHDITASLVIDATGFDAALVRRLPPEMGVDFEDRGEDVVIAENRIYEIDVERAKRAVEMGLHADEEVWTRLGFAGTYSTEFSHLSIGKKRAYVLIGLKERDLAGSMDELFKQFEDRQGYFTKRIYGGSGRIRIAHSLDRLVADGFMVIGEAACQVVPIHGSGVSSALYAGHLAARVAVEAIRSGNTSTASLWSYACEYQRTRGAVLATYDVTRLIMEQLTQEQLAVFLESGVMTAEDMRDASIPKPISMSPSSVLRRISGLIKNPTLIGLVRRMASASLKVRRHYASYPRRYEPDSFEAWRRECRRLFAPLTGAGWMSRGMQR